MHGFDKSFIKLLPCPGQSIALDEKFNLQQLHLRGVLKGDLLWNYDVGHPNIKGHNFFSLHISNKILESKLTN